LQCPEPAHIRAHPELDSAVMTTSRAHTFGLWHYSQHYYFALVRPKGGTGIGVSPVMRVAVRGGCSNLKLAPLPTAFVCVLDNHRKLIDSSHLARRLAGLAADPNVRVLPRRLQQP
jgi:hypothetical protein